MLENKQHKKIVMTLALIQQGDKILLGLKKRGFGLGRWNGFGGKVEEGESITETAQREIFEESGLTVKNLELMGVINFFWQNNDRHCEVHIFKATEFSGELEESEEMKPAWFALQDIPYKKMWSDDTYWLPLLLQNKKFFGKFIFDNHDQVVEHELVETP